MPLFDNIFGNAQLTQLGQIRPANTSATSLYTLGAKKQIWGTLLTVCNTTASATTWSVFHDADGTTYDQTTALVYQAAIPANTTYEWIFENYIPLIITGGSIGVQSGTASALTFTLNGLLRNVT